MGLLTAGYWPSTYNPSNYWIQDYWPEYDLVAPLPYVDGGSPYPLKPLDLSVVEYGLFVLLIRRLRLKRTSHMKSRFDASKQSLAPAIIEEHAPEEEEQEYVFVAIQDDKLCEDCEQHDGQTFDEDEVADLFPYAVRGLGGLINPMVHPNCRCWLIPL